MSDYEIKDKPPADHKWTHIHGASKSLAEDIHNAIIEGVSYGEYMGRKLYRIKEQKEKKKVRK